MPALSLIAVFLFVFVAGVARADHCDLETQWPGHDESGNCVPLGEPEPSPSPSPTPEPTPTVLIGGQPIAVTIDWENMPPYPEPSPSSPDPGSTVSQDTYDLIFHASGLLLFAAGAAIMLRLPRK